MFKYYHLHQWYHVKVLVLCSEHQTQAVGADRRNQPSKPGCVAAVGDLATTVHAKSSPGDPRIQH